MRQRRLRSEPKWIADRPATLTGRLAADGLRYAAWALLAASYAGLAAVIYVGIVPRFDILSPLTGHFLGFGLTGAAALYFVRRRTLILISGIACTLLAHSVPLAVPQAPDLSLDARAGNEDGRASLRVMAFNVWYFNDAPDRLVDVLRNSQAAVLLLSEVRPQTKAHLARLRDDYPYATPCAAAMCEVMVLSKLPLRQAGSQQGSDSAPGLAWAQVEVPNHLPLTVVATHVHRPSLSWGTHRAHMASLARFIRGLDTAVVLGGDLNATQWSRSLLELQREARLTGWQGILPTWPARPVMLPQFAIDHILVSHELQVRSARTGLYAGSDHLPVLATIDWLQQPQRLP